MKIGQTALPALAAIVLNKDIGHGGGSIDWQ